MRIFILLLLLLTFFYISRSHFITTKVQEEQILTGPSFSVVHYRPVDIASGILHYPPKSIAPSEKRVAGGVVAHHLIVQDTIAHYFQNISNFAYERVILIGPNHGELGDFPVVTSARGWDTPYGLVQTDQISVSKLTSSCVKNDNYPLENDHALEVIMPYIKVYLKDAKVIPLLVSGMISEIELDLLVTCLTPYLDSSTLVLVSSDFSHYLKSNEAAQKDKETLALLHTWDLSKIFTLTSDHLDSPPSLVILLKLMKKISATNFEVFAHTDASVVTRMPFQATTTHYFLNYYAQH